MKNTIPLVIAVVLGLVAVFAVSRMIRPKDADREDRYVFVVAAAKEITPKDGQIKESWLMKRRVESGSAPLKAIPWTQVNRIVGQTSVRTVARGDYLLASDVAGLEIRLSAALAEGEWAVPVTFSDPSLVRFLQPGDEIAILGTSVMQQTVQQKDMSEKPETVEVRATSVIFPRVRVLDIGKGDGIRRDDDSGGSGTIVVALTPQQSATIVAAQRTMELYPALRRTGDTQVLKRRDVGIVTDRTFDGLRENLEPVVLPDAAAGK
ncbi:MAG: Flp pilus assembly protein CpaB [Kiritimatiellae bacterium]|nr:Flp pilus assembly protein CpaB [Kiritimatiellia bacterium]